MKEDMGTIIFIAVAGAVFGAIFTWYHLQKEIESLKESLGLKNTKIKQTEDELLAVNIRLSSEEKKAADLHLFYKKCIKDIRKENVLLPSLVEWSSWMQEQVDHIVHQRLINKDRPALKAAEEVKEARALARNWKKQAESLRNRVLLYEAEVPWLVECAESSLEDVVDGLRQEAEIDKAAGAGIDPVRAFLSKSEWASLSDSQKNQLALDRYWDYRQRNAWAAGIQFERYVGYIYESEGARVEYHGAKKGFEDLGIDLVCTTEDEIVLVQCKRLSPDKGIPVRENTVAQIYGASLYYAHKNNIKNKAVKPVIITTYRLSETAKDFADTLGVLYGEDYFMERYPCIKCNISAGSGEKIYHLPFDQQYDTTVINLDKGECYASTVAEAEKLGFRRAYRWKG